MANPGILTGRKVHFFAILMPHHQRFHFLPNH